MGRPRRDAPTNRRMVSLRMASEEKSTAQISRRAELLEGARIADEIKREVAAEIEQRLAERRTETMPGSGTRRR